LPEKKKNRKKSRKNSGSRRYLIQHPERMARRDVKLAIRPQLQALKREQGNVKDDYGEYMNQLGFLYNLVGENLGNVQQKVSSQSNRLGGKYAENAGGLLESLGLGSSTAPDAAAAAKALGSQAMAGQRALRAMGQDAVSTLGSYQTQGELERLVSGRNAMGQQQDMLDDLRERRQDILANKPLMMKQRLDELRQLAWEQWMAEREFRLRAQTARGDEKGWDAFYDAYVNGQNAFGPQGNKKPPKLEDGPSDPWPDQGGGGQPRTASFGDIRDFLSGANPWEDMSRPERRGVRRTVRGATDDFTDAINGLVGNPNFLDPSTKDIMGWLKNISSNASMSRAQAANLLDFLR